MRKRLCCVFALTALISVAAAAQQRIYVNEYLNIGIGGRGLAMAGAVTATAGDVTACFWNPAGLALIKPDLQAGFMHADYFAGNAQYDYAGVAVPLKGRHRSIGISVMRFATDDIAYNIDYIQPDGSLADAKLKSVSAGDYACLLSYAQELKVLKDPAFKMHIGANAKIIYRHIGAMANAWGASVDAGLQSSFGRLHLGLMAKDITTTYTAWSFHLTERDKQVFGQTHNDIPVKSYETLAPRINIGIGYYLTSIKNPYQVLIEADADITTDGRRNTLLNNADISLDPHAGIEVSYKDIVYLRVGAGNFQKVLDDRDTLNNARYMLWQPSVGAGIRIAILNIDYAYTALQTQSNPLFSHIISARFDISRSRGMKKEDVIPDGTRPANQLR